MTVTFNFNNDFNLCTLQEAEDAIYDELIPKLEAKNVHLSAYGNHAAANSLVADQEYQQQKASRTLFDIARIKSAFPVLDLVVASTATHKTGSYGLKHVVERYQKPSLDNSYITNGDCIVAMLFKGYAARFAKQGNPLNVNCEFKAKIIVDPT